MPVGIYPYMRAFLMLLIMAITFNGYSAVAHAYAEDISHVAVAVGLGGDGETDTSLKAGSAHSDHQSEVNCNDCAHCCVVHIFTLPGYSIDHPALNNAWVSPRNEAYPGRNGASLFRPPISFT